MKINRIPTSYPVKKTKPEANDEGIENLHRHGCTALLFLDGFEFKDDYPW